MNFENLGEGLISDTLEDNDLYESLQDREQTGKYDLEQAKGFLSTVSSSSNISLYDHLADVLKFILRSKIPDAVDKLEELSQQVKNLRRSEENDLTEYFEIGEEVQRYVAEKQIFYKFKTPATESSEAVKTADEDDDAESDEEEDEVAEAESEELLAGSGKPASLEDALPDIHYIMSRFHEAGIGLGAEEAFELSVALRDLAIQFKLHKVRFWGKVLGLKNAYYVAEAPYQDGIVHEKFGWETVEEPGNDLEEKEEEEEEEEKEAEKDEDEEEPEDEEENEPAKTEVAKPPVPEPRLKVKKRIPPEAKGTGVNEYLYFVCTKLGGPWRVLPYMTPLNVSEARYLKRFLVGDLDSQIRGCVPYPGKEAHYLRAQIARITATTYIAPNGYYKKAGEKIEDDDDEDETEEDEDKREIDDIVLNPKFVPKATKYMYSGGLSEWCHCRRAILDQGRCIPMKLGEKADGEEGEEDDEKDEEDDGEEKAEEEEPEILEAIVETKVPMLRSLEEDRGIGRLQPWTWKLSSKLVEEKAVLIMYSNIWPGAYTFYDGKSFEHIYIGYGFKYSVFHYAPPIRVSWQSEYIVGDEVIEPIDEEVFPKDEIKEDEAEDEENKDEEEIDDEENKDEEEIDED